MNLRAVRTASLGLSARATAGLALVSHRTQRVVELGFESGESWGAFIGSASISTERSRTGTQSLKVNAGAGAGATLAKTVGPPEGKELVAWLYIETAGTNATLTVSFTAIGRSVSFTSTFNLNGLVTGSWVELRIPNSSSLGPLTNTTIVRVSVAGGPAPVMFVDDISLGPAAPGLRALRTASLGLRAVSTSSLSLTARRTT